MVEAHYNFQCGAWQYTHATGPDAGRVIFHSPQRSWSKKHQSLVLRQANGDGENKVTVVKDPALFRRCGDDDKNPIVLDAHAVIVRDGWARPVNPTCGPSEGDGAPLVPYHRGERVWIEQSLDLNPDEDFHVPVVSLDSLELFKIPYKYMCFIPQLVKSDVLGNEHFATPVGSINDITENNQHLRSQAYFVWPSGQPNKTLCQWDKWEASNENTSGELCRYSRLANTEERRCFFRQQWSILSEEFENEDNYSMVDDADDVRSENSSATFGEDLVNVSLHLIHNRNHT